MKRRHLITPLNCEWTSNSSWQTWHFQLAPRLTRQHSGRGDRTRPAARTFLPVCEQQMCPVGRKQIKKKKKCFYLHRRAHLFSSSHSGPLAFLFYSPCDTEWNELKDHQSEARVRHGHAPTHPHQNPVSCWEPLVGMLTVWRVNSLIPSGMFPLGGAVQCFEPDH